VSLHPTPLGIGGDRPSRNSKRAPPPHATTQDAIVSYLAIEAVAELGDAAGDLVEVDRFALPAALDNEHGGGDGVG
jgi:hypothetical protein